MPSKIDIPKEYYSLLFVKLITAVTVTTHVDNYSMLVAAAAYLQQSFIISTRKIYRTLAVGKICGELDVESEDAVLVKTLTNEYHSIPHCNQQQQLHSTGYSALPLPPRLTQCACRQTHTHTHRHRAPQYLLRSLSDGKGNKN